MTVTFLNSDYSLISCRNSVPPTETVSSQFPLLSRNQKMTAIERIQGLIEVKKPRVKEFFRDYDRLRHGKVSTEQFFRAFANAGINFTEEEQAYITQKYGERTVSGNFVLYPAALAELCGR